VPAPFKDVHETNEVGVHIGVRILDGIPDTRLGRQVHYPLGFVLGEKGFHGSAVSHILTDFGKTGFVGQAFQPRFLQVNIVVIIDVINANDFIAPIKQAMSQV
jgi:hypothetical protein